MISTIAVLVRPSCFPRSEFPNRQHYTRLAWGLYVRQTLPHASHTFPIRRRTCLTVLSHFRSCSHWMSCLLALLTTCSSVHAWNSRWAAQETGPSSYLLWDWIERDARPRGDCAKVDNCAVNLVPRPSNLLTTRLDNGYENAARPAFRPPQFLVTPACLYFECCLHDLPVLCEHSGFGFVQFNPFTPKSDRFKISPAHSSEILRHRVWRTFLFIAYSEKRWLYYQFSLPHLYIWLGECTFWAWEWKGQNHSGSIRNSTQPLCAVQRYSRELSTFALLLYSSAVVPAGHSLLSPAPGVSDVLSPLQKLCWGSARCGGLGERIWSARGTMGRRRERREASSPSPFPSVPARFIFSLPRPRPARRPNKASAEERVTCLFFAA